MGERYRREGETTLIEIKLNSIQQLFNSLDPSPFHEKDLDADAEDYIVGAAREFPTHASLKLVFHLPADHAARAETAGLAAAIHNYFAYRRDITLRDLRFQLHLGRHSLAIGLVFLFVCMGLRQLFFVPSVTTLDHILAEGLLISGWVAMWRPIQIFLYDWWPLRRMARVYDKLTRIAVDVREAA
jgi:hypothetical protein